MRFKAIFVLGLLLCAISGPAFGQAGLPWARPEQPKGLETEDVLESQLPLVRARMEWTGEVWVGQAVPLNVEVIVPTLFTGAPRFPELDVTNAVTLSPEGAVNFVVRSGGKTFSAQSRRYLIFPQATGQYTVLSAPVEVTYALPDGKPSAPASPAFSPLQFEAQMPPGAEGATYFLTTGRFQIGQSFDRNLEGLKVGDSIIRTVSMTAEGTLGMTLPALGFEASDAIRVYPGVPKLSERTERGKIDAARIETVAYVLEKDGSYEFPEIAILWWDPQTNKMNKALLPAIEFKVEENPGYNAEIFASSKEPEKPPSDEPKPTLLDRLRPLLPWGPAILGIFVLLIATWRLLSMKGITLRSLLAGRKRRRGAAEITSFKRFRKACLANDAKASLRELVFWLDLTNTLPVAPTLEQFAKESGIPGLLEEEDALQAFLFARPAKTEPFDVQRKWSGRPFYRVVAQARRAHVRSTKRPQRYKQEMLCLNPKAPPLERVT